MVVSGTSWDDSDSSASYACPMESVGSTGSGGRPVLDNIAELRESAEQLLDCSPPRTPPRSPAPRRLVKPPVNSHLHRAASIAPGMKAKKCVDYLFIHPFRLKFSLTKISASHVSNVGTRRSYDSSSVFRTNNSPARLCEFVTRSANVVNQEFHLAEQYCS